jgi:nicotinate (nicotinamide) nucleotide adenylyltransferase
MEIFRRAPGCPRTLGVLSGTFNPPTRAHTALARAALGTVDEVLFVLPRAFPHKSHRSPGFDQRLEMLLAAAAADPRFSVGSCPGGLFIDIARECRLAYGDGTRLLFLCGRDAAERIVNWDYGAPGRFLEMLEEFELLVAARGGVYTPPDAMRERIHDLAMESGWDGVSATEVRRLIARGEAWQHLVPEAVVSLARRVYPPR